jgi:hypothetical protein
MLVFDGLIYCQIALYSKHPDIFQFYLLKFKLILNDCQKTTLLIAAFVSNIG